MQGSLWSDLFCTTDAPGAQGARPPVAERREGGKKEKGEKWGGGREKFRGFFYKAFCNRPRTLLPAACNPLKCKEKTDVDLEKSV